MKRATDDDIAAYRELLLEIGVAVSVPNSDHLRKKLVETNRILAENEGARNLVDNGFFVAEATRILALPPEKDVLAVVRDALMVEPGYDVIAGRLEDAARARGIELAVALSCDRSPCSEDAKVSVGDLVLARTQVGTPKKKVRRPNVKWPLAVSYGLGVDSSAILVGLAQLVTEGRKEFRPDFVVFADVGSEADASYRYLSHMNAFLKKVGFPQVQIVAWATAHVAKGYGSARTLEQQALINQTMPSISASMFGAAKCSVLWKQATQNRWFELESGLFVETATGRRVLPKGMKIIKAIGYDADEVGREAKGTFRVAEDQRAEKEKGHAPAYDYWYPLQDWGWNRARCIAEIEKAIGVVPPKSSCSMCGAMKPDEIKLLPKADLIRALTIEQMALRGRHGFKFERSGNKGLGVKFSWSDFALEQGLVTRAELAKVIRDVDRCIAESPEKGEVNVAASKAYQRLPAFTDIKGFRGKRLPMLWDRNDLVSEEKKA